MADDGGGSVDNDGRGKSADDPGDPNERHEDNNDRERREESAESETSDDDRKATDDEQDDSTSTDEDSEGEGTPETDESDPDHGSSPAVARNKPARAELSDTDEDFEGKENGKSPVGNRSNNSRSRPQQRVETDTASTVTTDATSETTAAYETTNEDETPDSRDEHHGRQSASETQTETTDGYDSQTEDTDESRSQPDDRTSDQESNTNPMPDVPDPDWETDDTARDIPEDVQKYARFKKMDGAQYERVNEFLRDRTYITAREWAMARLCADFRTETGVEMTKIGENLPELVPFMTDTYTPQAVNQARSAFEEKVRKAGATFLYGAMCDFFTAEELDDVMYEATEVAKFLLEVEGVDLAVEDELEAEERISSVMRDVREASAELRADEFE